MNFSYDFKNNNNFLNFSLLPQKNLLLSGYTGTAASLKYTLTLSHPIMKKSAPLLKANKNDTEKMNHQIVFLILYFAVKFQQLRLVISKFLC